MLVNSFRWDFGNGATSNDRNPNIIYGIPDTFNVTQIIQSQSGQSVCLDTFQRTIIFPTLSNVVAFPNAFIPNGDSRNDYFTFVILDENQDTNTIEVSEFKIFNRWGQLVYDNENPDLGWNGQIKGEPAPAEVYGFIIELISKNGTTLREKGNVTLLRH